MSKSLGQVAHEAFEARYENSRDDESWTCESERQQQAWQAAAQAVERRVREVPCGIECGLSRAVIKAAEVQSRCHDAWADGWETRHVEMKYRVACLRTCRRVRELQEARDE